MPAQGKRGQVSRTHATTSQQLTLKESASAGGAGKCSTASWGVGGEEGKSHDLQSLPISWAYILSSLDPGLDWGGGGASPAHRVSQL